jgi:ribonuclease P protein component
MNQKFPKSSRLLAKADFDALKDKSIVFKFKDIRFIAKKNVGPSARLGLAVSRRVGNAVVRNRIKRLAREEFRKNKISGLGVDLLIIPFKGISLSEVSDQISSGFLKIYDDFIRSNAS